MQNSETTPRKIHIVGICGVATSALAIAFHKKGYKVSGSDKGFFPPVSTELEKAGVNFYAGWHVEKMCADEDPDVVIVGTASGRTNPETIYAEEKGIPIYSFAEAIGEFFVRKNSIVCVGTWGKTSSSAILSYIMDKAGLDPSYMFGGISLSHEGSAKLSNSEWSVFEGDEYKSSPKDNTPKFVYYRPNNLLLSSVSWDHADLYPTEESFFAVFEKLISTIPQNGVIVACNDNLGVQKLISRTNQKFITYGRNNADYVYSDFKQSLEGIELKIRDSKGNIYEIRSELIGEFQAENITGCFAIAKEIGIDAQDIINAIKDFKGLKRRLEKRLNAKDNARKIMIFDDIAHSPEKVSYILKALKDICNSKITLVFEPNIGNRKKEIEKKYDNAFKDADEVIIPRLTKLKIPEDESNLPVEAEGLCAIISKTHSNAKSITNDNELVDYLDKNTKEGGIIVFAGAHGFRNMIEETVEKIKNN